jgi:hypothetical protein
MERQWADDYGSRWYLHYDGHPPDDDDRDYQWTGAQWVPDDEEEDADEPLAKLVKIIYGV